MHPDAGFHDGPQAMKLMKRVLKDKQLAKRPETLDTLAAVYARNGMFKEAEETQIQALAGFDKEVVEYPSIARWRPDFECRLKSYKARKAWQWDNSHQPFGAYKPMSCEV